MKKMLMDIVDGRTRIRGFHGLLVILCGVQVGLVTGSVHGVATAGSGEWLGWWAALVFSALASAYVVYAAISERRRYRKYLALKEEYWRLIEAAYGKQSKKEEGR